MSIRGLIKVQKIKKPFCSVRSIWHFVKNLETYKAELNVGDLLTFHRKSVHTSTHNYSKKYSFAAVFRIWGMSKDLTINRNLGI